MAKGFLQKKSYLSYFILLVILLLFIFNSFNLASGVKNFFYVSSEGAQKYLWQRGQSISSFFVGLVPRKSFDELSKENSDLKAKIQRLEVQNVKIFQLEEENASLRMMLDARPEKNASFVIAQTVAKDPIRDFIRINKGYTDGIEVNDVVLDQNNALVGRVTEINKNFSIVSLISNTENVFDAQIIKREESESGEGKSEAIVSVVKGQGNFKAVLDLIPKDKEIKEEEVITTSSLGGIFPSGILVGYVKSINDEALEAFKKAEINLAFDINNISIVFVLKD